jgi:hypothetical protein
MYRLNNEGPPEGRRAAPSMGMPNLIYTCRETLPEIQKTSPGVFKCLAQCIDRATTADNVSFCETTCLPASH